VGNRRNRPPNRWGCKPDFDVCVEHDLPLECRHGCRHAASHSCGGKMVNLHWCDGCTPENCTGCLANRTEGRDV
jgi:hypothetical protein